MSQSTLARVHAAFPDTSPNLKAHGFVNVYNAGLRGGFKTVREGDVILATRERDGFRLEIDLQAALTSNEGSRINTGGMQYPYTGIDQRNKFFLPAGAIKCKVRTGADQMEEIACEGFLCLTSKEIRVDCVDLETHYYFWYVIGANCMAYC